MNCTGYTYQDGLSLDARPGRLPLRIVSAYFTERRQQADNDADKK